MQLDGNTNAFQCPGNPCLQAAHARCDRPAGVDYIFGFPCFNFAYGWNYWESNSLGLVVEEA